MTEPSKSNVSEMGCGSAIAIFSMVALGLFLLMCIAARLDRVEKALHLQKPCTFTWSPPDVVCPE